MDLSKIDFEENKRRMQMGELYYAFTPDLIAARRRCELACQRFNNADIQISRRKRVELWRDVVADMTPLPALAANAEEDDQLFSAEPWVHGPVHLDYGTHLRLGPAVFINFNCTILDTGIVTIGARTLIGPNVSIFAASHPEDPYLRDGTNGPELGRDVSIGEDVWVGGNVLILPGVTIGNGAIIGAGSVVTRDVPDFWIVAGNPARLLRKVRLANPQSDQAPASQPQPTSEPTTSSTLAEPADSQLEAYRDEDQGW